MTAPTDWARISDLFDQLLALPPGERRAILAAQTGAIRQQVQRLLDAMEREGGRFAGTAFSLLHEDAARDLLAEAAPGSRVGPYEIVREVGRGGMGVVYEAFRTDDDYRKRVAIKLVSLGARTAEVMQRFRRERRILAGLEHRNVAALLDGGYTAEGVPFVALEFVEGTPIDQHIAAQALSIRDRIALMRQVCAALQYAHQRLVIHRDLKPGNILVTADGTVKLLDFGVAKLLVEDDRSGEADRTGIGAQPFTPAWASPEQLLGDPLTIACDIHGLGLVLYQVLTGRHPFRDSATPAVEIRRRILEDTPPPSGLGRDLDAVLQRALEKQPAARYPSVAELSADLLRFLEGRPLLARPGTRFEQWRKFAARHRAAVAAATLAAVSVAAGVTATLWQARRAVVQQSRAEEFGGFLRQMLSAPDPTQVGRDARVLDLLGAAMARLESGEVTDPVIRADLERTLGSTYAALGVSDTAAVLLEGSLKRNRTALGDGHAETARSRLALAQLEATRGRAGAAESLFIAGIASLRRARPANVPALATGLANYGNFLFNVGRPAEAQQVLEEALVLTRSTGLPVIEEIQILNSLGMTREHQGDRAGAKGRFREAIVAASSLTGVAPAALLGPLANLANTLKLEDSLALADSLQHLAVGHARGAYGEGHAVVGATLAGLADIRRRRGEVGAAEAGLREALRILGAALPPDHLQQAPPLSLLGLLLCEHGRAVEGEPYLRRALDIRVAQLPPGHWFIHNLESALAVCLAARGRHSEALAMARSGHLGLVKALGADHPRSREAAARLAALP